jgi:hypothetical protein
MSKFEVCKSHIWTLIDPQNTYCIWDNPRTLTCWRYILVDVSSLETCYLRCQTFVSMPVFTHTGQVSVSVTKRFYFASFCLVHIYIFSYLFVCRCKFLIDYFLLQNKKLHDESANTCVYSWILSGHEHFFLYFQLQPPGYSEKAYHPRHEFKKEKEHKKSRIGFLVSINTVGVIKIAPFLKKCSEVWRFFMTV